MACCGLSSVTGLCGLAPSFLPPRLWAEALEGSPPRFPPVHSKNMAATPSSLWARATHDYDMRTAGSPPGNSSCGGAKHLGEAIPHYPGLPKANPGPWWVSFLFGKSTVPFTATVLGSPGHAEFPRASSSTVTCDLARAATRKQPGGQPSKANASPILSGHHQPPDFQALGPFESPTLPLLLYSFPRSSPPLTGEAGCSKQKQWALLYQNINTPKKVGGAPLFTVQATRRLPDAP
ncbi:LOW QUALITY PROTEIN: uncharacterized protein LOC114496863 [Phyllostomus discolor]|uniref:LOW QUALITY PROTEIN: uncharacterized protein LOC114496863 n=1 Tax=Phyllostomus discolor TaxID=89673 RepID=A0A7E6DPA5_9CHIR|nr:LOW QUALITY PROTEIN: uncharacterized protein LOC114496863 [Phyllostomus discolor]